MNQQGGHTKWSPWWGVLLALLLGVVLWLVIVDLGLWVWGLVFGG